MNWPLYLIENSLADERRYKREAKKLLSGPDVNSYGVAQSSLNTANERIPQLKAARNLLLFGHARWINLHRRAIIPLVLNFSDDDDFTVRSDSQIRWLDMHIMESRRSD